MTMKYFYYHTYITFFLSFSYNLISTTKGAIISPGPTSLTTKDLYDRLDASKASCIITTSHTASLVNEVSFRLFIGFSRKKLLVEDINEKFQGVE